MALFNLGGGGGYTAGDAEAGYIYAPHATKIVDFQFVPSYSVTYTQVRTNSTLQVMPATLCYGNFPLVSQIGQYAFNGQSNANLYFPNITVGDNIGVRAFSGVANVYLPNLDLSTFSSVDNVSHILYGCKMIHWPQVTTLSEFDYVKSYTFTSAGLNLPNLSDSIVSSSTSWPGSSKIVSIRHSYPFLHASTLIAPNLCIDTPAPTPANITLLDFIGPKSALDITIPSLYEYTFCYHYSSSTAYLSVSNYIQSLTVRGSFTTVPSSTFYRATSLSFICLPSTVTTIGSLAFVSCTALANINIPNVTTINNCAFMGCSALISIEFSELVTIGSSAFALCTNLIDFTAFKLQQISHYAFHRCTALRNLNLSAIKSINNYAFASCTQLKSLDLTKVSSVPTCEAYTWESTTFTSSYYIDGLGYRYGSIYVPASLYNSFITATNWTTISARIVSV